MSAIVKVGGGVIGLAVAVAVAGIVMNPKAQDTRCGDAVEAYVTAQERVTESLKNPNSASYASMQDPRYSASLESATCRWTIKSYVDATNSFGGTIRTAFEIKVQRKPDGWYTGNPVTSNQ